MFDIIDVSTACAAKAADLAAAGVKTIIRYYSRDTLSSTKRLTLSEARALASAGLRIGIVHEARHGNTIGSFSKSLGLQDGAYAGDYGATTIGQPAGSTIYFAVDFDASKKEIKESILPYFEGAAEGLSTSAAGARYEIGVYGSGAVCKAVLDAGTAKRAWLSQSKGWTGYDAFLSSGRWVIKQLLDATVAGVPCDPDVANSDNPDIGDFALSLTGSSAPLLTVIARSGLRLRSGPGTEFDTIKLLPLGTKVHSLKAVGDWTMIDIEGDGAADGFASSHFLQPV